MKQPTESKKTPTKSRCGAKSRPASDIPANLFKEIELPNGNTRVHLLRFNTLNSDHHLLPDSDVVRPVGNANGVARVNGSLGGHGEGHLNGNSMTSVMASKPKSHVDSAPKFNLLLPGGTPVNKHSVNQKKIMVIDGEENNTQTSTESLLDTEIAEFSKTKPSFHNNLINFNKTVADQQNDYQGDKDGSFTAPAASRNLNCDESNLVNENNNLSQPGAFLHMLEPAGPSSGEASSRKSSIHSSGFSREGLEVSLLEQQIEQQVLMLMFSVQY